MSYEVIALSKADLFKVVNTLFSIRANFIDSRTSRYRLPRIIYLIRVRTYGIIAPEMAKKRKRGSMFRKRSNSAASKRKRRFVVSLACIAGLFIALIPLSYFWLLSWLQGDGFRAMLEEKLSNKAKADIVIPAPLQLHGNTAKLADIEWKGTGFIKEAEVKGITAEINRGELFDRCLHAPSITLRKISAAMDTRKESPKSYSEEGSGFFSNFTPNRYIADRIECSDTEATLTVRRTDAKKKPYRYTLKGSTFVATPIIGKENSWQAKLRNGTLTTSHSYLAKSSIRHALLHYTDDTVSLSECQLALTKGNMDATGSFNVRNKDWNISLGVGNADVERLLSESWQDILTGEFSGNLKMSGKNKNIRQADGHFALRKGRFRALSFVLRYMGSGERADMALRIPGQQAATDYLEDTFKLIEISRADCNIRFPHNNKTRSIKQAWLFDNIDIRTKNDELRVQGHVILEQDGKLHGTIRVGINEKNINEFTGLTTEPVRSIINSCISRLLNAKGESGFRWININLSGTSDSPQQDFSIRVQEVIRNLGPDVLINKAVDTVQSGLDLIPGIKAKEADKAEEQPQSPTKPKRDNNSLIETAGDTAESILNTGVKAIPFL